MRIIPLFLWAAISTTIPIPYLFAQQPENQGLSGNFLKTFAAKNKELQDFYSHLIMSGTSTLKDIDIDVKQNKITPKSDLTQQWEYSANGDKLRWVGTDLSGSPYNNTTFVFVATPLSAFRLQKRPDSSNFSIISLHDPVVGNEYSGIVRSIRIRAVAATSPFAIFDTSLADFLNDKNVQIKHVSQSEAAEAQGIGGVRVDWEATAPNRKGSFLFSSDNAALREFEFHFTDVKDEGIKKIIDIGRYGSIEYSPGDKNPPVVRRVQIWRSIPAGKYLESVFEVTDVKLGGAPLNLFTLDAFGLSMSPRIEKRWTMFWLTNLTLLCAIGAYYFWRKSSKPAQTSSGH